MTTVDLTSPPDRGVATRLSLLAVLTTLTLELLRASGPLLDRASAPSIGAGVAVAIGVYAVPGIIVALLLLSAGTTRGQGHQGSNGQGHSGRASGFPSGRVIFTGAVLLAVLRLVLQTVDDGPRYVVGLTTVALAVGLLTLTVAFVAARPDGGHQAALGLTLGVGLSAGLQLSLGTWDAIWRHSVLGWIVTVVLCAGVVMLARLVRTEAVGGRPRRLWSLGPYLALATMILANPAFAASQDGARLPWAGGALVIAAAIAFLVLLSPTRVTALFRIWCVALLPVAIGAMLWLNGPWVLVCLVIAQGAAGVVLATALGSRRSAPPTLARTAVVSSAVGLGLIVPLLVYQLDYDVPLGFPNQWVIVATALAFAFAGLRLRTPAAPGSEPTTGSAGAPSGVGTIRPGQVPVTINPLRLLILPSVALAIVGMWASAPAVPTAASAGRTELRVLDWNLHYGVEPATTVDLERIARTIEAQDPDVITLQEVSRGWLMAGGTDMATWLSHRLGMQMVFAPAADRQFGNVILSRSTLADAVATPLPYGDGPQHRSAISATVTAADGTPLRVTSVHLQHLEQNLVTRLTELATMLAEEPATGARLIGGDLNAEPGAVEITTLTSAGWTSALDTAGGVAGATSLTSPSTAPVRRIDWIVGHGVTFSDARVLTEPRSSDHLPVVTTVVAVP